MESRRSKAKTQMVQYKGSRCQGTLPNGKPCKVRFTKEWNKITNLVHGIWTADFHHIDPKTKAIEFGSSHARFDEAVRIELDKCLLICKACHSNIHYKERLGL